jgi:hypothetical protein
MKKNPEWIGCEVHWNEVPRVERPIDDQQDDQDEYAAQNSMVARRSRVPVMAACEATAKLRY